MNGNDQSSRVVLLPDDPSDVDEFDAKAHDTVAKAIADLVQHEPGGKAIGLEGSWGSGKSTVVRLLSKYLLDGNSRTNAQPETRTVIFDAWAHQGDPLRRTFLETLVEELVAAKWLPDSTAAELREKLTGKASQVHTKSTERLSLEGAVVAAATTLVPPGIVLAQNHFHSYHRLAVFLGIVLLAAPFVVVVGFAIAQRIGVALGGKNQPAGAWRRKLADVRAFSLFAKEQVADTVTEGVERGEPTSVEFENLFSDVLKKALGEDRRLLLVLDNLDRVEEDDAKTILATMQTFTGSGSRPGSLWAPNVWTLIPYDPAGLDRLWNSDSGAEDDWANEKDGAGTEHVAPLLTATAAAFTEKIFQVRFEAPPLVLSDWRGYLLRLLQQALPGAHDDELQPVLRLRRLYPGVEPKGLVAAEEPTPRQLKQFVNQLGAIRRQRDDVPLVHVGYYVLLRRDRIKIARRLIAGMLPHKELSHLFKEGLEDDLAALHFGTAQALAQQLLLGRVLDDAFAKGDSTMVEQLKERTGFADALESLDWSSHAADGGVELTRAVAVLAAGGAFEVPAVEAWSKEDLYRLVRTQQSWRLDGRETGVGLAILFDGMSSADESALSDLLARVAPAAGEADTDGHLQLQGVAGFADGLIKRGRSAESLRVRIEIPTERLPGSLAFFGGETSEDGSRAALELGSTPAEVAQTLVQAASTGDPGEVDQALEVLLTRSERVDLATLAAESAEWLRGQDPTGAEQLDTLLNILDLVRRSVPPEDVLGATADDGTLMHLVSFANRNAWYVQAAGASMLHLLIRPELAALPATRETAAGTQIVSQALADPATNPEIVSAQLAWLERHSGEAVDLLTRVSAGSAAQPWVDHQLQALWSASALALSAEQYLQDWQHLQRVLEGDGFAELTRSLLSNASDRRKLISDSSDPALAIAVLDALETEPAEKPRVDVRNWTSAVVKSASESDWQAVLDDASGGPLLALALKLSGSPEAPSDPPGLENALHPHFQALAAGQAAWQPDGATFLNLTGLLGAAAREVLAGGVCAWLEGRDGTVDSALFATYGDFLASERAFRTHKTLPNVVARLVARDEWGGVDWFVETANAHRDALQLKNRRAGLEHLRNKVAEKLAEFENEEPPEALSRLSELLGSKN